MMCIAGCVDWFIIGCRYRLTILKFGRPCGLSKAAHPTTPGTHPRGAAARRPTRRSTIVTAICLPPPRLLHFAGVVSLAQSILFPAIALAALALGVDNFIAHGFGELHQQDAPAFTVLCGAFALIALLGLAITPAERALLDDASPGWVAFGSQIAYLGHMGTIAFFTWWLAFAASRPPVAALDMANVLVALKWGLVFELVFVGAWVWIIAYATFRHRILTRAFGWLSVAKASSFWFAYGAFLLNQKWLLVAGIVAVACVFGPLWHIWIAFGFLLRSRRGDAA